MRRPLLAVLLCLLAVGFALAGEAAHPGMLGAQVSIQHGGDAGDCGDDGMAGNACTLHCAAGACVVSVVFAPQITVPAVRPASRETLRLPDGRHPPETAPPKLSLS